MEVISNCIKEGSINHVVIVYNCLMGVDMAS